MLTLVLIVLIVYVGFCLVFRLGEKFVNGSELTERNKGKNDG